MGSRLDGGAITDLLEHQQQQVDPYPPFHLVFLQRYFGRHQPRRPARFVAGQRRRRFRLVGVRELAPSVLVRFVGVPPELLANASRDDRDFVTSLIKNIKPPSLRFAGINIDSAPGLHALPLERIAAPTLIVSALDDGFKTAPAARYAAERIPGAKLVLFDTGGHLLVGYGREVRTMVRAFLDCVDTPR